MSPLSTAVLLSIGLALLRLAWKMADWLWIRPKKLETILHLQGLSSNSYQFLFGDLKESSRMSKEAMSRPISLSDDPEPRFLPFLRRFLENHGKDSFMWIGPTPRVNVMSPQLLKDVFVKMGKFQKAPHVKLLTKGLATLEGDKWAMHRKIINSAFHMEKLKLMLPAFHLSCSEMIGGWDKLVSSGNGTCEIDVWPYLENLSGDVISRTAFGSSFEEGRRIFELQKELAELIMNAVQSIYNYIPGWRFVPTKANKRMKGIQREVEILLQEMIQEREKAMKAGEAASNDLLGLLLESNLKEIQQQDDNNQKTGMSTQDVIEECKLIYFAGQGTTSVLLAWTMVLLSVHPEWQERARDEVLQAFGSIVPDFDGLNHLKIVAMVLNEVMRLYPPVPILARQINKETTLGSLTIPAGVQLSLPIAMVHRDPELWGEDAREFKPERFMEGVSKAAQNQVSYFPFGWGPRICIGQNFAVTEAKMALAMMLQSFRFELSPTYVHSPTTVITLRPQHGVQIILHRR